MKRAFAFAPSASLPVGAAASAAHRPKPEDPVSSSERLKRIRPDDSKRRIDSADMTWPPVSIRRAAGKILHFEAVAWRRTWSPKTPK